MKCLNKMEKSLQVSINIIVSKFRSIYANTYVWMLMLRFISSYVMRRFLVFVAVSVCILLPLVSILHFEVDVIFVHGYEVGVKPGDWIEYELNWD